VLGFSPQFTQRRSWLSEPVLSSWSKCSECLEKSSLLAPQSGRRPSASVNRYSRASSQELKGCPERSKIAGSLANATTARPTDWFPHISPDGNWLYTISYPMDQSEHTYIGPGMQIKLLRLKNGVALNGAELTTVRTFFGGQGSGNTGGWAPDSTKFAWTEYDPLP